MWPLAQRKLTLRQLVCLFVWFQIFICHSSDFRFATVWQNPAAIVEAELLGIGWNFFFLSQTSFIAYYKIPSSQFNYLWPISNFISVPALARAKVEGNASMSSCLMFCVCFLLWCQQLVSDTLAVSISSSIVCRNKKAIANIWLIFF